MEEGSLRHACQDALLQVVAVWLSSEVSFLVTSFVLARLVCWAVT